MESRARASIQMWSELAEEVTGLELGLKGG